MTNLRYKVLSDSRFEIVGRDEVVVATVELGHDDQWRIIPKPEWVDRGNLNIGPFGTSEEAFNELGASAADQS